MAELTKLEDKLGEVLGLAKAGKEATAKVARLVEDETIVATLRRMGEEAAETARRCEEVAGHALGQEDSDPRQGPGDDHRGQGDDEHLPRRATPRASTASSS